MAKRKSSFYHTRWNKVGINEQLAADILGVTVEEVLRFDEEGAPLMAERLLLLWDKKHIGYDGWEGFRFSRGVLCFKKLRFTPASLLHLVEQSNINDSKITHLKRQLSEFESHTGSLSLGDGKFLAVVRR